LVLQARPAPKTPDHEEDEPLEEEEEKDLSIPGPSYVKLMALTPVSALPGTSRRFFLLEGVCGGKPVRDLQTLVVSPQPSSSSSPLW